MDIIKEVEKILKGYDLYSQDWKKDPLVLVHLFDCVWSANWYITEYRAKEKIAFWYVELLSWDSSCDEWGYISIKELSNLKWNLIKRIEVDLHFTPQRFSKLKVRE